MATTIDKLYATEEERKPFANDDETFTSRYERISDAKASVSDTEPFTESQMLRDPRMVCICKEEDRKKNKIWALLGLSRFFSIVPRLENMRDLATRSRE